MEKTPPFYVLSGLAYPAKARRNPTTCTHRPTTAAFPACLPAAAATSNTTTTATPLQQQQQQLSQEGERETVQEWKDGEEEWEGRSLKEEDRENAEA